MTATRGATRTEPTRPDLGAPAKDVVYIGKAERAARVRDEAGWRDTLDPYDVSTSGFIRLVRRNHATNHRIAVGPRPDRNDGFDPATALAVADGWEETRVIIALRDRLTQGPEWSIADIEYVLIRIAVRLGVPIGNAQGRVAVGRPHRLPTRHSRRHGGQLHRTRCVTHTNRPRPERR